MNLTQKISQMTPKGADLAATDLIEVSTLEAGSYVTKSITGQELIDAIPLPPSGLTIGTTPIASGTIGRVLFEGTGNVLQQSSSLFWDNTNGRLGIGTSSPAQTFQVYRNTSAGYLASFNSGATLNTNASLTVRIENANLPSLQALNAGAGAFNTFALNPLGGNILIGTTTDAGFKLDVNGTARVSDNLLLTNGIIATSTATTRLQGSLNYFTHNRIASSGVHGFQISNYGTVTSFWRWDTGTYDIELGSPSGAFSQNLKLFTSGVERLRITGGGNVLINTTTDAGFRLDVNGTARVDQTLQLNGTGTATLIAMGGNIGRFTIDGGFIRFKVTGGGDLLNMTTNFFGVNQTSVVPSAIMAITSTNRGFLPPRMTTTEKNAIATPAAGLQVFDTTLNMMSYYNGTIWISL
jgi:hypothetical protein